MVAAGTDADQIRLFDTLLAGLATEPYRPLRGAARDAPTVAEGPR